MESAVSVGEVGCCGRELEKSKWWWRAFACGGKGGCGVDMAEKRLGPTTEAARQCSGFGLGLGFIIGWIVSGILCPACRTRRGLMYLY
ncbi:pollen-specific leucine-rich repeat extensin-like protein 4 [Iris pallida]|uniref:Pollen-specific leucine-rich repeat extensin-like protein 4 n=1 Tax=Iris pallida TaxID=29817 RepID=A0AAX6GTI6_IRIPA|nr:pollen-specific leucine-rich repeat extensin-like protein 4 [Iris pallida]